MSLLLSLSSLCVASIIGYVSQDYEKVSEKFTHVFVLKIESISTSETYTHYKNGTNTLAKNSIYIQGKILRQIYGVMPANKINLKFTNYSTVQYDSTGKVLMSHWEYDERSGMEFDAKIGETYIFSLASTKIGDDKKHYNYLRMDEVKNETKIKKILSKNH